MHPGGPDSSVPAEIPEQKAEEKIAEQPMHPGGPDGGAPAHDEQMVPVEDADGVKSKSKQPTTGAVRFAVENPQLLHRFDFKETAFAIFVFCLVVLSIAKPGRRESWR